MTVTKTDGDKDRDEEAVIAVDWETVETQTGQQYPHELRRIIERVGSTSEVYLDKWGYADYSTTALFTAVEENARIIHPDRGPLPRRYITLRGCDVTTALRVEVHGADLNFGNLTTTVEDGLSFVDGLAGLVDAAEAIDEQCDSWYSHPTLGNALYNHPEIGSDSYGPDKLGYCYISASRKDKETLDAIDTSHLPIERESVLHRGECPHADGHGEHYTAIYRHERYYSEDDGTASKYSEKAAEIGLLGSNLGHPTSIRVAFKEKGHEYEEVDSMTVLGQGITVYEYEKDGETRYAAEWSKRVKIDEAVFKSLLFDNNPDSNAIKQAALIEEARLAEGDSR